MITPRVVDRVRPFVSGLRVGRLLATASIGVFAYLWMVDPGFAILVALLAAAVAYLHRTRALALGKGPASALWRYSLGFVVAFCAVFATRILFWVPDPYVPEGSGVLPYFIGFTFGVSIPASLVALFLTRPGLLGVFWLCAISAASAVLLAFAAAYGSHVKHDHEIARPTDPALEQAVGSVLGRKLN